MKTFPLLVHVLFILTAFRTNAQLTDSIVGLDNDPMPEVHFTKMEISSGSATTGQLVTLGLSSNVSCCINYNTYQFYYCDGKILTTVDAISGLIVSVDTLMTNSFFTMYKYNPCDSNVYGYVRTGTTYTFSKFNTVTRIIDSIAPMPNAAILPWGNLAVLDVDSNLLIIDAGNVITGINILSGTIRYSAPKINLPGETFGHIALKCITHEIIGTSADINVGVKYLSTIDPYTGIVSHISTTGWNQGVWKPIAGGSCINQLTGDYFYSGAGGLLIRVNTITGDMISSSVVSNNEMYYVDHFSTCACEQSKTTKVENIDSDIKISVRLENNLLSATGEKDNYTIEVFDINSRIVFKEKFLSSMSADLSSFSLGMYVYKIYNEKGQYVSGKFLKS